MLCVVGLWYSEYHKYTHDTIYGNFRQHEWHAQREVGPYVMYTEGVKCVEVKNILTGIIIVFMSY